MEIKNKLNEKEIISFSICLFGFFPILPEKLKGLPVIILFVLSVLFYFRRADKKIKFSKIIKLSSLYLINLLSVFYSGNFHFPINKMETTLSLLIIPLTFGIIDKNIIIDKLKHNLFKCFIISTSFMSLVSLQYYYSNKLFVKELFKVNSFRNLIIDAPFFGEHPIYVSMFLGISILLALVCLEGKSKTEKTLLIISCLINIFHMLLLSSKGVFIAMMFSFILLVFFNKKGIRGKFLLFVSILGLFLASVLFFPNMERRFREIGKKSTYTNLQVTNSSSIRIAIYECAFAKIKENPVFGYGWGLGDKELTTCYKEKSNHLFEKKYNSHNQYLGYYLDGGAIAFLGLIFFMYNRFKYSIINTEHFFSSFILLCSVLMLTENILSRQSGVIIFIFFISFFSYYKANIKQVI